MKEKRKTAKDAAMELNAKQLSEIIQEVSDRTVLNVLQGLGLIKETITSAEIKRLHGRKILAQAQLPDSGLRWFSAHKAGRGIQKYTNRNDFKKWLFSIQGAQ